MDAKDARVWPTGVGIPIAFVVNWAGLISYKGFILNFLELDHDDCFKDQNLKLMFDCAYDLVFHNHFQLARIVCLKARFLGAVPL